MENKEPNGPLSWEEAKEKVVTDRAWKDWNQFIYVNELNIKSIDEIYFAVYELLSASRVQALEEEKDEILDAAAKLKLRFVDLEKENKRLEEELGLLKIHCEWQTNLKSQAESALEKSWEENKRLQERLSESFDKGVAVGHDNTDCNYHSSGSPSLNVKGVERDKNEYYNSLKK